MGKEGGRLEKEELREGRVWNKVWEGRVWNKEEQKENRRACRAAPVALLQLRSVMLERD